MSSLPVYVGLDYHSESIRVCVLREDGTMLLNKSVPNCAAIVNDCVDHFGIPSVVGIEACCGAADFATELRDMTGWNVQLAHAGYVAKLKRGRDKTDHGDAWLLADLCRVGYLPQVWLADEETRQLRRLLRYRESLSAERKKVKLRIRALLREDRVPCPESRPWTKKWMAWLKEVNEMGEQSRWVLNELISNLEIKNEKLKEVEKRMREVVADDELNKALLTEPGIGLITAFTLRAEVGDFSRFKNGKQLARFCGVTPRNASSGQRMADAGMIKESNENLRRVLIEAAKRLPRHEQHWEKMKERLIRRKPANVVSAAIANRWIRSLFYRMKDVGRSPLSDSSTQAA